MAEVALRETIEADLGTLFEFQADPEASAMAAFPSRDPAAFLEHQKRIKADPSMITRTIVVGERIVGSIGSWEVEGERDVGFWIGRDHWGNGYATAALRAFLTIDLHRPLHAHVADHNAGSRRVLERCGFVLDHSAQEEDVLEHVLVLTDRRGRDVGQAGYHLVRGRGDEGGRACPPLDPVSAEWVGDVRGRQDRLTGDERR
jgi:RimJ/RimL family protein N-acetyltransferase